MIRSLVPSSIFAVSFAGLVAAAVSACGGGAAPTRDPAASPSGTPSGTSSAGPAAPSPDAYSSDKRGYVCGCMGPRLGVSDAECTDEVASSPEVYVAECFRAAPNDCGSYVECVYNEPSGNAKCAPGEEYTVTGTCATCRCAVPCGDGKPACASGKACEEDPSGKKVCR